MYITVYPVFTNVIYKDEYFYIITKISLYKLIKDYRYAEILL